MFWSCQDVILIDRIEELEAVETEMIQEEMSLKSATLIPLQLKDGTTAGTLTVKNSDYTITVKFAGNSNYDLEEVQLWLGTDLSEVPTNKLNKPIPGHFTYKSSGKSEYIFNSSMQNIVPGYYYGINEEIHLLAHCEAKNKDTGEKESAWSKGTYYPNDLKQTITYSSYTPVGGGGCFPYMAFCGENINGTFYFDMTRGDQNIVSEMGNVIGTAINDDGFIKFDFDPSWMFSGATPELVVTGYDEPSGVGHAVHSGAPMAPDPPVFYYYGPLVEYDYYTIELKVQYCTTQ